MTLAQWIFTILLIMYPLAIGAVYLVCQVVVQFMPKQRTETAERIIRITERTAKMSARQVERTGRDLSKETKRELTLKRTLTSLKRLRVPLPPEDILDDAIDAAVE